MIIQIHCKVGIAFTDAIRIRRRILRTFGHAMLDEIGNLEKSLQTLAIIGWSTLVIFVVEIRNTVGPRLGTQIWLADGFTNQRNWPNSFVKWQETASLNAR